MKSSRRPSPSTSIRALDRGHLAAVAGGEDVAENNLLFLALQTKVQNVSQTTQLLSNIIKTDSDAKLNAIRNVRT